MGRSVGRWWRRRHKVDDAVDDVIHATRALVSTLLCGRQTMHYGEHMHETIEWFHTYLLLLRFYWSFRVRIHLSLTSNRNCRQFPKNILLFAISSSYIRGRCMVYACWLCMNFVYWHAYPPDMSVDVPIRYRSGGSSSIWRTTHITHSHISTMEKLNLSPSGIFAYTAINLYIYIYEY